MRRLKLVRRMIPERRERPSSPHTLVKLMLNVVRSLSQSGLQSLKPLSKSRLWSNRWIVLPAPSAAYIANAACVSSVISVIPAAVLVGSMAYRETRVSISTSVTCCSVSRSVCSVDGVSEFGLTDGKPAPTPDHVLMHRQPCGVLCNLFHRTHGSIQLCSATPWPTDIDCSSFHAYTVLCWSSAAIKASRLKRVVL